MCKVYNWVRDHLDIYPDHVMINDTFPILRTEYFASRLSDLDKFAGFCPRWIIPQTRMVSVEDVGRTKVATNNMIILDSKLEIKVGVGLNSWPPVILEKGDAMIPAQVAKYLGRTKGD